MRLQAQQGLLEGRLNILIRAVLREICRPMPLKEDVRVEMLPEWLGVSIAGAQLGKALLQEHLMRL
eukprot:6485855-Amphidinium_carterae.1